MLKTINVDQVIMGMYIHALEGAWIDHPFWKSKFVLSSEKDLAKLRQSNLKRVTIDTAKGKDVEVIQDAKADEVRVDDIVLPEEVSTDDFEHIASEPNNPINAVEADEVSAPVCKTANEEHARALEAISKAKEAVTSMFSDIRMGKAIDGGVLGSVVDDVTASIERNQNALISLARLKTKDDYTYMHSVAVCGLMIALGKQLGLNESEVKQAGMAGLMHDIGKARVPLEILNKPGKLTDEEYQVVQQHAQYGYEMLLEAGINDPVALDVCLHHHEKYDGTGYPKQHKAEEISIFARMGAICDVYDAVTSNRPYKAGWEPAISLQRMAQWRGHFDEVIFKAFVKSLGIYPIGSTVKLDSELLAVVIDQNSETLLSPVVRVFYSAETRSYLNVEDIDLATSESKIVGLEDPKSWGIKNIDDIWLGQQAVMQP